MKGYRTFAFNGVIILIAVVQSIMDQGMDVGLSAETLLGIVGIGNVVLRMITNTGPMAKE